MKILSFGSLNLDQVYSVPHFVSPGETLMSDDYNVCFGGKGLNQSIAAARGGAEVFHAGAVGHGGEVLLAYLQQNNVDSSLVKEADVPQGHAIIQVSPEGENCIVLYPGSNHAIDKEYVDKVFDKINGPGYVILQNEISELAYIVERAAASGFDLVLNASPYDDSLKKLNLKNISWLLVNEIEGEAITGENGEENILSTLQSQFPHMGVVLTLGSKGCICVKDQKRVSHGIFPVPVVDTTGAGDTFAGYFVAALSKGFSLEKTVKYASAAAAIAVSSSGAAQSIPCLAEVEAFLSEKKQ